MDRCVCSIRRKVLLLVMVLASLYAYSLATHTLIFTIPMMAKTHGILNAFGFVACNLLVWTLIEPKELITQKEPQIV